MILLTSTSDAVQVVTSAAAAIDVHASWVDALAGVITPGRNNKAIVTATTTTVVAAPASSTQRNLRAMHIRNKHASLACDVTVQHTDGATIARLYKLTLSPGDALEYTDQHGFVPPPNTTAGIGEAPVDGQIYGRQNSGWTSITASLGSYVQKAGDTMSGALSVIPTAATDGVQLSGALGQARVIASGASADIGVFYSAKGNGAHYFYAGGFARVGFSVAAGAGANTYVQAVGAVGRSTLQNNPTGTPIDIHDGNLLGTPTAVTPPPLDSSAKVATTAFVSNAVAAGAGGAYVGSTPPASPAEGKQWLDDTTGILYTYHVSTSSSAWIETGPADSVAAGTVVQTAYAEYTALTSTSAVFAGVIDAVPQQSSGTELLTVTISPKAATNKLRLHFNAPMTCGAASGMQVSAFRDGTANAIASSSLTAPSAAYICSMNLDVEIVAGSTAATTFKIRYGNLQTGIANNVYVNGYAGNRYLGGTQRASLQVTEIAA
jgi:hypothetical protein